MKCKVKSTGEILEVKGWRGTEVVYSTLDMNRFFQESELDIISDTPEESVKEGWVARNANGKILFFNGKEPPERPKYERHPKQWIGCKSPVYGIPIVNQDSFPSVTWESEPKKVRITITPIEE